VRLRFHLGALSKRETHEYITHRLKVAGAEDRTIFDSSACDTVFRFTGGVPRLINVLCDTTMLCAFAEERMSVDEPLVRAAVEELQWVEYSERIRGHDQNPNITGPFSTPGNATLAKLEVLLHDQLVGEFMLPSGRAIIGRTPDNDVQIRSKFISRHHAQIVSERTQSVIEDLNSTNGVFIRSERVKHHTLADGDIIQLGEHKLLYRDLRTLPGQRPEPVDVEADETGDESGADTGLDERPFDEDEALEEETPP
jgi:general secretion pathway protein A